MPLFRRTPQPEPPAPNEPIDPAVKRYQVLQCVGCGKRNPPFVYMSNGKDYCVPCAKRVTLVMRVEPAGKRDGDITTLDG